WKCHWWVRARLGLFMAVTAPLTLVGNALRGAIGPDGHFTFHVELWMDLLAFALPGAGVVVIGYIASMMQGEKAELRRRELEGRLDAREPLPRETGDVRGDRVNERGEREWERGGVRQSGPDCTRG